MQQQINLLNAFEPPPKPILPPEKMLKIMGVLIIILIGLYINLFIQKHKLDKEYKTLSSLHQIRAADLSKLSQQMPDSQSSKEVQSEVDKLTQAIGNKAELLKIIDRRNRSFADYMEALARQIQTGVWLKEIIIDQQDQNIALLGRTLNANLVPIFLTDLSREKAFSGVIFEQLKLVKPLNKNLNMAFALRTVHDAENIYIFPEDAEDNSQKENTDAKEDEKSTSQKLLEKFIKKDADNNKNENNAGGLTDLLQGVLGQ
jgi:hypothetical protein